MCPHPLLLLLLFFPVSFHSLSAILVPPPPSLNPHPPIRLSRPPLSLGPQQFVHALSAAGMLNAHFTRFFAQRFAYLQVNCCECSRRQRRRAERLRRRRGESDGRRRKGRERGTVSFFFFFLFYFVPLNLNYRCAPTLHASRHPQSLVCLPSAGAENFHCITNVK